MIIYLLKIKKGNILFFNIGTSKLKKKWEVLWNMRPQSRAMIELEWTAAMHSKQQGKARQGKTGPYSVNLLARYLIEIVLNATLGLLVPTTNFPFYFTIIIIYCSGVLLL